MTNYAAEPWKTGQALSAHKNIHSTILDEVESFDFKNGIDLGVQEGEYLILVVHGQGYTLKSDGSYHLVTLAMKIMPYDENHSFINVLPVLNDQKPVIAHGL